MSQSPAFRRRSWGGISAVAMAAALATGLFAAPVHAEEATILNAHHPDAIPGSYIVALNESSVASRSVEAQAASLSNRFGGQVAATYDAALNGFSVKMDERAAKRLAAHPAVDYVEQDMRFQLEATQPNPPSWGLDRIDQRNRPLDNSYTYPNTAPNVNIYILDTGVRLSHNDFGGRAFTGFDAITPGGSANDCNGHGTHVAGTAAGSAYGVAKDARIFSVRVLGCTGGGTTSQIVAGINWVTNNHIKPAVANMSLGGGGNNVSMNNAVANSIAAGVTYSVAAGNSNANACNFSPARVSTAITVGATQNSSNDARASYSNFGSCTNIFAPGSAIAAPWHTSNSATNTISGTSMAAPHVAGAAALVLSENPTWTPSQVGNKLISDATTGVVSNPGTGSPNRLLYVDNSGGGGGQPPPGGTIYQDSFETSTGWVRSGNATAGLWERGAPEATSHNGIPLQLSSVPHGSQVLVTGRLAGNSPGAHDVDDGVTIATSPSISLPSSGSLNLVYEWYFAHLDNATSDDFFRVSIVSGGQTTVIGNVNGSPTNRAASWSTASLSLNQFAGQSIQIQFETADNGTPSLIEAAVDNVRIIGS